MSPSWADFVESLCPIVRELGPGDAPRDWVGDLRDFDGDGAKSANDGQHAAGSANDAQCAVGLANDGQHSANDGQHAAGSANTALARSEPSGSAPS